jgi:hypothetical protein
VEWLDLVTPSAAILALLGVIALVVVAIRQGRAIRRLEERLSKVGESAVEAPLQRIAELQARHQVSEGGPSVQRQLRMGAVIGVTALVLVAAIGGVWYLFVRDDGGSAQAEGSTPAAATQPTTANPPKPVDETLVPDDVAPLDDPGAYTLAVFNASGVAGAAGDVVAPLLENEGYSVPLVANPPDGATGRRESVVMWSRGNKQVAQNVAKVLGIKRAPPIDGYTPDQVGNADAVVLVGLDIANGGVTATP